MWAIVRRALGGHLGVAQSVRLSVPWRSCLSYRHAGCLQLCHHRPPAVRGLRTSPRTDIDPPRFLDRTAVGGRHIVSPPPGRNLVDSMHCVTVRCPSVCSRYRPLQQRAARLLLWARRAGDIDRLLHGRRPTATALRAAARRSAANASSVTFTAAVRG